MENMTAQITAAQKKAITKLLNLIDDPTTIHNARCILNRCHSQQTRAAKKGGEKGS